MGASISNLFFFSGALAHLDSLILLLRR